jgi:hypothetical protein
MRKKAKHRKNPLSETTGISYILWGGGTFPKGGVVGPIYRRGLDINNSILIKKIPFCWVEGDGNTL